MGKMVFHCVVGKVVDLLIYPTFLIVMYVITRNPIYCVVKFFGQGMCLVFVIAKLSKTGMALAFVTVTLN